MKSITCNSVADFPPEKYQLRVHCHACQHGAVLTNLEQSIDDTWSISTLHSKIKFGHRIGILSNMYIFHHLPKCGGTSVVSMIDQWFIQVRDYQDWGEDVASFDQRKLVLSKYDEKHCLCGHFATEGTYLHQRYPEVINNPAHQIFTFVRDPLELKLSLYYFLKSQNKIDDSTELKKYIMYNHNYIAWIMGCDRENFRTILDHYFFIGLTEELQKSVDYLARMIDKPSMTVPVLNTAHRQSKAQEMNDAEIAHFKEINSLDYLIYEYCQKRFISQTEQL